VQRSERTPGEGSSRCLEGSSRQPLLVLVLLRVQQQRLKVKGRDQQRKESRRPIWGPTALHSSPRSNWLRRAKEREEERRAKDKVEKEEKEEKEEEVVVARQEVGLWWLLLLLLLHLLLIPSQLGRARAPTAPARRSIREGS